MKTKNRAFTLVELLVVVIIIAVLAGIAIPKYSKTIENARMSEAINMLGIIRQAQIRYAVENMRDEYAANLNALDVEINAAGKYFNFAIVEDADPIDDYNNILAEAVRNGYQVGGGYTLDYWIQILEDGNITQGAGKPPDNPSGGGPG